MKNYEDAFELHRDIEAEVLACNVTGDRGIYQITDNATGEVGYVFVDETEMFHPRIYECEKSAAMGREHYNVHCLGDAK